MPPISPENDLDLSLLYEIADGSEIFIIESIDMFLQQTPELLQAISDAIGNKDWGATASSAHKLKSNLGFFGMPVSQGIMQEIELTAKAPVVDASLLTSKFNEANVLISQNITSLEKIKAEMSAGL